MIMKVKELLSILGNLDSEMEVKMDLFNQISIIPDKREEFMSPFRVDCYNINDVLISVLSTRSDSLGNIYFCVEYLNNDGLKVYAFFKNFSSVLDFISSNFK